MTDGSVHAPLSHDSDLLSFAGAILVSGKRTKCMEVGTIFHGLKMGILNINEPQSRDKARASVSLRPTHILSTLLAETPQVHVQYG